MLHSMRHNPVGRFLIFHTHTQQCSETNGWKTKQEKCWRGWWVRCVSGWRDAVYRSQASTYSSSMTSGLRSLVCVLNQDEPVTQSYLFLCAVFFFSPHFFPQHKHNSVKYVGTRNPVNRSTSIRGLAWLRPESFLSNQFVLFAVRNQNFPCLLF